MRYSVNSAKLSFIVIVSYGEEEGLFNGFNVKIKY